MDKGERLQNIERRPINSSGPLGFPEEWKDPNMYYYWAMYDADHPWSFQFMLRKSYRHVTVSDIPELEKLVADKDAGFTFMVEGDKIGVKCGPNKTQYLMCVPMEVRKKHLADKQYHLDLAKVQKRTNEDLNKNNFVGNITLQNRNITRNK